MSKEIVKFVRKSNDLVEARYKFDIWESRIFTKMLTMIHRSDEDFKDYKIYLKDIVQDFDLEKNKEAYELLRDGARTLMKKSFYIPYEVDGVKRLFETPVVSSLDSAVSDGRRIQDDQLYLTVSFHPKMKPYLLQLKSQFTMYDVRNILKLPSAYSIRIYELLKQYEKIGWRVFVVEELKEILGIEDKYRLYGHFKKRVLEKAQEDLKSYTDIWFDLEEVKKGRAVHKIKFHIHKNGRVGEEDPVEEATLQEPAAVIEKTVAPPFFAALWQQLQQYDVTQATLSRWLAQYEAAHVNNCVQYVFARLAKGEKPSTVGGYISRVLSEGIADHAAPQRKKAVLPQQKTADNKAKRSELERQLKELYAAMQKKEEAVMEVLFLEVPGLKETVFEQVKGSRFSHYDPAKTEAENFQNPIFAASFRNAVRKQHPARFEALDKLYQPQVKELKAGMAAL